MKAILYNRILLLLGFLGICIAGTLSLAKFMNVVVPCGLGSSGCEKVTSDASSMLFGVIPIAYIGLGAYLVLTVLAFIRTSPKTGSYPKLVLVGYLMTAFGALVSIGLQAYSLFGIGDICPWCMASAVNMTASVILYALYYQDVLETSPEALQEARVKAAVTDRTWLASSGCAALIFLGWRGYTLRYSDASKGRVLEIPKDFPLIPSDPNVFGNMSAPIKVIEFADLNCPACQKYSPMLKDFVRQHPNSVCVIYRHFPLPMHKTSQLAAAIDEYAAEKGKFWDYTLAVMGTKKEIDDPNELFLIASQQGLDVDDMKRHLSNEKDPIYVRLNADENAANVVGVTSTPTFIVEIPNNKPKAFTGGGMLDAFNQKPYTDYLGTKS